MKMLVKIAEPLKAMNDKIFIFKVDVKESEMLQDMRQRKSLIQSVQFWFTGSPDKPPTLVQLFTVFYFLKLNNTSFFEY